MVNITVAPNHCLQNVTASFLTLNCKTVNKMFMLATEMWTKKGQLCFVTQRKVILIESEQR